MYLNHPESLPSIGPPTTTPADGTAMPGHPESLPSIGPPAAPVPSDPARVAVARPAPPPAQRYLTTSQVCAQLACTKHALIAWRRDPIDPLPCARVGKRALRYPEAKLLAWLRRREERAARATTPRLRR